MIFFGVFLMMFCTPFIVFGVSAPQLFREIFPYLLIPIGMFVLFFMCIAIASSQQKSRVNNIEVQGGEYQNNADAYNQEYGPQQKFMDQQETEQRKSYPTQMFGSDKTNYNELTYRPEVSQNFRYCSNCGASIPSNASFCEQCGKKL